MNGTGPETSLPRRPSDAGPFQLGDWLVEPSLNRVRRAGASSALEPRVMHVLTCLAHRPGQVLSRADLMDTVWSGAVVNEEALTQAISQLRHVFGDDSRNPRYIQTIHKGGYRIVATVRSPARPESVGTDRRLHGVLAVAVVIVVAIALTPFLSRTRSSVSLPPAPLEEIPFTSYEGREICPALSPDGTRVAFSWDGGESGNYDIYVKQRNTENPLRLTDTPKSEFYACWSPDGASLAYAVEEEEGESIYTLPAIGGPARKILDTPVGFAGLDWSPDGRRLAYSARPDAGRPLRLHLFSFATGQSRELTLPAPGTLGDYRPAFSPDGRRIAFLRGDRTNLRDLFWIPAEGGDVHRLTYSQHSVSGFDWTPDGKSIVFTAGPTHAGGFRMWRLYVEEGTLQWLPTRADRPTRPSSAIDGPAMVFEEQSVRCDIWVVRLGEMDGEAGPSSPLIASTLQDYAPQYSPGGSYVSFLSTRSGSPQVWVSGVDGKNPRQLTEFDNAYIENHHWSYDERYVAFSAAPGSYTSIYVADRETGEVRRVTSSQRHEQCLGWSRDGDWIYGKSERDEAWWVWKMRTDGSGRTDLMQKDVFRMAESRDGRHLLYSRADTSGVWESLVDGTDEHCVVNEPETVVPCGWRESADGIYFFCLYDGDLTLRFLDRSTGVASPVISSAYFLAINIDVSPDGRSVICDRLEITGSDLVLVDQLP